MFWNLTLAHLVGDYFLQPDWMIRKRGKWWILLMHGGIHLGLLILFLGPLRSEYWLISILLALLHVGQDAIKVSLIKKRPTWEAPLYIIDQTLHLAVIWCIIWGFQVGAGTIPINHKEPGVIIAIAFIYVTFIWFISERTFSKHNPLYVRDLESTKWLRMLIRSALAGLFLVSRLYAYPILAAVFLNPYRYSNYPRRAFWTDISVSILAGMFLLWGIG